MWVSSSLVNGAGKLPSGRRSDMPMLVMQEADLRRTLKRWLFIGWWLGACFGLPAGILVGWWRWA